VINGVDTGRQGVVKELVKEENRMIVDGINIKRKKDGPEVMVLFN